MSSQLVVAYVVAASLTSLGCATAQSSAGGEDAATDAVNDAPLPADCATRPAGWQLLEPGFVADADPETDVVRAMLLAHPGGDVSFVATEGDNAVVRSYAGGQWSTLGNVVNVNAGNTPAYAGYLARTAAGDLVLSAVEFGGVDGTGVYVFRLEGETWTPIGAELSTASASVAGAPLVVFGEQVNVLWSQYFDSETIGKSRINGKRWEGSAWSSLDPPLGQIAGPGASAISPHAAIDGDGRIYLVFAESSQSYIRYRDQNDATWQTLGTGIIGSGAFDPRVALADDGTIYVAYSKSDVESGSAIVVVERYNGSAFQEVVSINEAAGHANIKGLVATGGRVIVAWVEGNDPTRAVYVADVAAASVEVLGGAQGSGVVEASLAVDACGDAVVAYTSGASGARVVRVVRHH
ncbi:MAG: hypothetical protein IPL79_08305 [Myxococcales bacterium]|nr:hypothetical protein [Myxococcales bacterium]